MSHNPLAESQTSLNASFNSANPLVKLSGNLYSSNGLAAPGAEVVVVVVVPPPMSPVSPYPVSPI